MKKKVIVGIISAVLVLAIAIPTFAAVSDAQKKEIGSLLTQIAELRKQVVDKYAEAGVMTKEQADQAKKNIDQATKYEAENPDQAGQGFGCGGNSSGMMGNSGYGMMRGYNSDAGNYPVGETI